MRSWVGAMSDVSSLRAQFKKGKPFPHLVLPAFFSKRIEAVSRELLKEKFVEQNSDLFQFKQTGVDVAISKNKILNEFHTFFGSKEFLNFVSKITRTKVTRIDMAGFIYGNTDYLLPHDDRLEGRKIAYVINLSEGFKKSDGGELQFFECGNVVKSIVPMFNALVLFKVSPKSVHQVREVVVNKKRLSLAGWFHG